MELSRRNLRSFLQLSVLNPHDSFVISTEGGAFAVAVERPPHLAFAHL
jgi:hypothetical protein